MKFSVVVPVYNVEQYLDQCLGSLQAQDFIDYEVVCVNDGSTDQCPEMLANWEARFPQIKVIDQENCGLSTARNTGLKAAQGDYVVFVDSDDWVETNMLRRLETEVDGTDVVCFDCQRVDKEISELLNPEQSDGWSYYNRHALEPRNVPFVCVWQRCYCREFLIENNLFFREGILHEDNEFTPRACLMAKSVKVIPDVLYNYRVRPGSIMTTRALRSKESLIIISNELSELFANERGIDKTTVYRALTQYYQMAFLDNNREDDCRLRQLVNWESYRRVSRTKLRHRWNYLRNKFGL